MEREIEALLSEMVLLERLIDFEIVDDDPEGYRFTQGWIVGLTRALEILRGGNALEEDEIDDQARTHLVKDGAGL